VVEGDDRVGNAWLPRGFARTCERAYSWADEATVCSLAECPIQYPIQYPVGYCVSTP
jgi:hypothetical protein